MTITKTSYSLDAAVKELAEKGEIRDDFTFTYRRKKWTMKLVSNLDVKIILGFDADELSRLDQFKVLLGDAQWDTFPDITAQQAGVLMDAYTTYLESVEGEDLEKSEPTSDS